MRPVISEARAGEQTGEGPWQPCLAHDQTGRIAATVAQRLPDVGQRYGSGAERQAGSHHQEQQDSGAAEDEEAARGHPRRPTGRGVDENKAY